MPFQRRRKLHIPLASHGKRLCRRAWLTIWDRVKIPRYNHKLMHRKRVTCELHDSFFRLMMIKHAIPKTAEIAYSVGQLWEKIEWAWNKNITRCTGSSSQLEIGCCRENSTQQSEPQAPGWAAQENEKDTLLCPEELGRSICCSPCSVYNSLSHTTLSNKVRGTYFSKEVFARPFCVVVMILHASA